MRRCTSVLGLLLLGIGAGVSPAAAATTADFQANCAYPDANGKINCVFDARRQSSNGPGTQCNNGLSPTQYFWEFDNGSPPLWTTSPLVSSVYDRGPDYEPSVTVFCSDGTSASQIHCFPTTFGFNGCIRPNGSWTP